MLNVDITLWDFLYNSERRWPDKMAIKHCEEKYTYRELKSRTLRLANFMRSRGIEHQDEVAVMSVNCVPFVEIMFANARLGAVTELLNWRIAAPRLCELMEESKAKILFFSKNCEEQFRYLRENLSRKLIYVCVDADIEGSLKWEELHDFTDQDPGVPLPSLNDRAIKIYSSGTTSMPKRMYHTVKDLVFKAVIQVNASGLSHKDVYMINSPLFHVSSIAVYAAFYAGASCILGEPTVESMVDAIQNYHATRIGVVPTILNRLLDYLEEHPEINYKSVNHIEYGSAPMTAAQIERGMKVFGCEFSQYYGATETMASITCLLPEHHLDPSKLRSVGKPLMATEIKIMDPDGNECPPNVNGEIITRHPSSIESYIDNPELSAEVIKGDWYYTGDIGYLDEDGFLYLVDRKNDMIISGGENIYPKEVMASILKLKAVKEVAVTGVPDEKFGEAVMAAVVLKPGAQLSEEDIIAHCKTELASYKKPKYIYFVSKLPLTDLGKVDKKAVKQIHFQALEANK